MTTARMGERLFHPCRLCQTGAGPCSHTMSFLEFSRRMDSAALGSMRSLCCRCRSRGSGLFVEVDSGRSLVTQADPCEKEDLGNERRDCGEDSQCVARRPASRVEKASQAEVHDVASQVEAVGDQTCANEMAPDGQVGWIEDGHHDSHPDQDKPGAGHLEEQWTQGLCVVDVGHGQLQQGAWRHNCLYRACRHHEALEPDEHIPVGRRKRRPHPV